MDEVDFSRATVVVAKEHEVDIVETMHQLAATVALVIAAAILGQQVVGEDGVEALTITDHLMICLRVAQWLLSRATMG